MKNKVPSLRFPEFKDSGEWVKIDIKNIAKKLFKVELPAPQKENIGMVI
ncbi:MULTISPECIES: hypothetical protein [unclassified Nitratiruptor]|nr:MULTISPECIES: hypothetical protein [unclassified Nitratiruptor]BCD59487.1 hypothetical protein NitYY0810_C0231 [Nitratiruptor sp. YY08-10]BCD63411.1 hypothetical protein NitYY0814_C0231 [Nitratiruptor sp. YY08-14]